MFIEDIVPSSDQNRRNLMVGSGKDASHDECGDFARCFAILFFAAMALILYSDRDPSYKTSELFRRRRVFSQPRCRFLT